MAKPKAKTLQQRLGFFDDDLKKPEHDDIIKWTDNNMESILFKLYNLENWSDKAKSDLIEKVENIISKDLSNEKDSLKKLKSEFNRLSKSLKEDKEDLVKEPDNSWKKDRIDRQEKEYKEQKTKIEKSEQKIIYLETFKGLGSDLPKRNKPRITERTWEYTVTNQSHNRNTGYKSAKNIIGFVDMKVNFIFNKLTVTGIDFEEEKVTGKIEWTQTEKRYPYSNELLNHNVFIEVKTQITTLGELFRQLNTYKEYLQGDFLVVCPDDTEKETIENQGFRFIKYEK
tara:strand:+ start:2805 stop:3656 length:852 start_codon:yes stop_codon:yes gene_type:complete